MPDFLDSLRLNPSQRLAAGYEDGGVLVLAGAGTGKTRVLTSRIGWLLAARGFRARDILAVTFTNKAAKEMRARAAAMVSFPPGELALGTFHGVCHRMLRRHTAAAGWRNNFQIMDSQDQKGFIRRMLSDNGIDKEEFPPSECMGYINAAKENGFRAAAAPASHDRARAMREIYALYEDMCRRENKLDFAELLLSALDILEDDTVRRHYAVRFRHILIDEFQDTNRLQYRWLKMLDSGENIYFAVGDDDQSIYAFRGADPENMRRIGGELRAQKIIRLEQNYRSTGNILTAANSLIANNKNRMGKNLITDGAPGALVRILQSETDGEEAESVADAMRQKIAAGMRADNIAVLYRANAQSRLLEKALVGQGVRYRIYGGLRFFDRMEIKHALAYLRLAVADDLDSLLRVINTPPRGIGKKTLESLAAAGGYFAGLESDGVAKAAPFRKILHALRKHRENGASLAELARAAVEESGLLAHCESRPEDAERAENLREFVSAAEQFRAEESEDPAQAFLSNAALESGESQGASSDSPAVNLMTAHAAKGLEFPVVFVVGLEEGMFPSAQSLEAANTSAVEEERRLMYVAITRAREELFLYYASRRMIFGQTQVRPPSRFLTELPREAVAAPVCEAADFSPPPAPDFSAPRRRPPAGLPAAGADSPYRPGEMVRHAKYGNGVVIRREGRGKELKVEVAFKRIGSKTFLAAAAPLTRL